MSSAPENTPESTPESTSANASQLAINGGPKAFDQRTGKPEPKIGVEEFFSIAERFGFNDEAMQRLRAAVSNADLQGGGPNLARYACAFPKATKSDACEALVREMFEVKHARVVSSGTAALHAAMVAVGVKPGKEVIVPATGFIATAMAIVSAGGRPVFCDVDASLMLDPDRIEPLINEHTVAIAPTHWIGFVCDMDPIVEVARRHNLRVVEDCAQAPGASYKGRPIGTLGDIGCFSISAYKIIGGGEGGLIVTDDERLFERANQLAEAGGLWRPDRFAASRYPGELFAGLNYRLSELEAAVDLVQYRKLPEVVGRFRRSHRRIMDQVVLPPQVQARPSNDADGDIGYSMVFHPESLELGQRLAEALRAEGVGAGVRGTGGGPDWHYYAQMLPLVETGTAGCAEVGDCPTADALWGTMLTLGVDQWWSEADCDRVAAALNKVFAACCPNEAEVAQGR